MEVYQAVEIAGLILSNVNMLPIAPPFIRALEAQVAELELTLARECPVGVGASTVEDISTLAVPQSPSIGGSGKKRQRSAPAPAGEDEPVERILLVQKSFRNSASSQDWMLSKAETQTLKLLGDAINSSLSFLSRITDDSIHIFSDGCIKELVSIPTHVSERFLNGYVKWILYTWPILHSAQFRDLPLRRHSLEEPFEISTLSLVYAIAGQCIETSGE
jgi:hypothetical protein